MAVYLIAGRMQVSQL